ncbi:unnamed protein product [Brachionus calyciflorus]|uniref:Amine oxidase domain-containing protein n=1 Tax=Brachionus calyciflorus TaxID=104777 RepID=A0A813U012_9BILA|nr:unnamed protein product [Brachionus calyciflorus]
MNFKIFILFVNLRSVFVNEIKWNRDRIAKVILSKDDIKNLKDQLRPEPKSKRFNSSAAAAPIKVGIIGAGISGLYSALILKSLGINFEILEANENHIGGRVFTYYFTDKNKKGKTCREYHDYAEMGPMRIPKHVTRLVGNQSWSLVNYLRNSNTVKNKPRLIKYNYADDNTLYYFNGKKTFSSNPQINDPLGFSESKNGGPGSGVPDHYANKPFWEWIEYAIKPFLDLMDSKPDLSYEFIQQYDNHSVRTSMSTFDGKELRKSMGLSDYTSPLNPKTNERIDKHYPQMAINWMETLDAGTGFYDRSLAETVIDAYEFSSGDWVTIDGGISRLVDAMNEALCLSKSNLQMGNKVVKIEKKKNKNLVVTTRTKSLIGSIKTNTYTYDHVISTIPLGLLQTVDTQGLNFDLKKEWLCEC